MKKQIFCASLFSALLCTSTLTHAYKPQSGWYLGAFGGASYVPELSEISVSSTALTGTDGKLRYNIGGNGGLSVGYRFKHMRLEGALEVTYTKYKYLTVGNTTVPNGTTSFSGQTFLVDGMINGYYDHIRTNEDGTLNKTVPYVGIGVGYGKPFSKFSWGSGESTNKQTKLVPVYQGILGLNYYIDDYTAVGFDYRYKRTGKLQSLNNALTIHNLNVGFTFIR